MPTVIDSLVLQFSLDPTQFTRGQQEVVNSARKMEEEAKRAAIETETSSKKLGELFTGLKREALAFAGLAFGGIEARRFFDFIVNLDANTSRLSRTLGINVQELSAWQSAARTMGGTGQEVAGTIAKLTQEVWNFRFGVGSNLPGQLRALGGINVFDEQGNAKNGIELIREMTSAVERLPMPTAGKAAFLRVLGLDETTINLVIKGRAELEKTLDTMRATGTTTEESARAAEQYQKSLGVLENAASNLGRTLVTILAPGLARVFDQMAKLQWITSEEKQGGKSIMQWLRDHLSVNDADAAKWDALIARTFGSTSPARARLTEGLLAGQAGHPLGAGGVPGVSEMSAYIRAAAIQRGIDPDIALQVAASEGLYAYQKSPTGQSFVPGEQSFGPFQLHYGGGLGDTFTRRTGKDARDPSTWQAQVDFALDQAKGGGWRPWHGWTGAAYAGIGSPGGSGGGARIVVQNMTVNSKADDAAGIAKDIKSELTRSDFTSQAPQGQQ